MTIRLLSAAALPLSLAVILVGCGYEHKSSRLNVPTSPSPSPNSPGSLTGSWASAATIEVPSPDSCNAFQWTVTEVAGSTVSGDFTASCAGGLDVVGTGSGVTNGNSLAWEASGTATQDGATCEFTLEGTAVRESNDTISVDYDGTVCALPVSGSEVLHRD